MFGAKNLFPWHWKWYYIYIYFMYIVCNTICYIHLPVCRIGHDTNPYSAYSTSPFFREPVSQELPRSCYLKMMDLTSTWQNAWMSLIGCLTNIVGSSPIYLMHISCRCFQICIYLNSPSPRKNWHLFFLVFFANFYRYLDGLHIHVYLHSYLRFYSHLFRDYIYIYYILIL